MGLQFRAALMGASLGLLGVSPAMAQPNVPIPNSQAQAEANGGPTVASQEVNAITGPVRLDPYYQPKGIPLGGPFRLYTNLGFDTTFDDNVFRTATAKEDDVFFTISPTAVLNYETSLMRVDLYGQANVYEYSRLTSVNTTNYEGGLQGSYEISRAARASAAARYRALSEPLSSPNVVGFQAGPTQFINKNAGAAFSYKPNRLGFTASFSYDKYSFLSTPLIGGGTLGNRDRDNQVLRGSIDTSYDFSPGYAGFVRLSYNTNPFDRPLDRTGTNRSSNGYQADAGVRFLLSELLQGEVYGGYIHQDYDQAQLNSIPNLSGLDFGANLTWYPTDLMTVTLGASRSFQNTTLAGASAGDNKNVSLAATYSVTRQINLRSAVSYDDVSYKGTVPRRNDQTFSFSFGGQYLLNHYVALDLDYRRIERTSSVPGINFQDNMVILGLNLQI